MTLFWGSLYTDGIRNDHGEDDMERDGVGYWS